jgi:N-acetyl sugar amidotransferase
MNSMSNPNYRICSRCIVDTTVPGVKFDIHGICNFCKVHDKMEKEFPTGTKGKEIIDKIVKKIKKEGQRKKYDCVLGISGGRDSSYTIYYAKKILGLNPLAVHFNDGFGNPTAGENMIKACKKLGVDLRTITSDWRESKDLKITGLKASTVCLMEQGTDLGIASALYGVANHENIKYLIIGQSFRTEGIMPLAWNYLDGDYLRNVHKKLGKVSLRKWKPSDPGFNLGIKEMIYYALIKRIKTIPILYYVDYIRKDVDKLLKEELDWENTGAHYFDDLYQSVMSYVFRTKFNCDRRKINYSALIRSGQMTRNEGLKRVQEIYTLEDSKIINLCIKRLGISQEEFESYLRLPVKTFRDYKNNYWLIKKLKPAIWLFSKLNLIPGSAYDKYFNCGE